jgi:hypothetical protein
MAKNKVGAPKGNRNAVSKKPWQAAIDRALAKRTLTTKKDALDALAERLLQACDNLDVQALRELGDRIDGKVVQQLEASVDASLTVELVRFADTSTE